jgi:hypothetical protein
MTTTGSMSGSISASAFRPAPLRRPGAAPVVTLILDEVHDDRLEAWLAAAREQLSHPITPARLREEVETLGRLRWPNNANRVAELEDLYYDVEAKHYPSRSLSKPPGGCARARSSSRRSPRC